MRAERGPLLLLVASALLPALLVLPAPGDRLIGHALSEAPSHLWMQWLLDRALWEGHAWFGQEGLILGERLWVVPADWATRLLVGPLGWALGRVSAYNVGMIGLLVLASLGTARLARQAGAAQWPAALAGALVVWHPALLGYVSDGRIDSAGIGWAALLGAAWLALVQAPSTRAGVLLGLSAAAVVLAGINLTIATALIALVPTLVVLLWRPGARRPMLIAAGIAAAAAVPVGALLVGVEGNDPGRLVQQSHPEGRGLLTVAEPGSFLTEPWFGAMAMNAPEVQSLWALAPQVIEQPAIHRAAQELVLQRYAPGGWWFLAVVPLVALGVGLARRPRAVAPWAAAAVLLQLLALGFGPSQTLPLSVNGTDYAYLAPAVLLEPLPVLGVFNNYGLFGIFAAVAAATGAAVGLSAWTRLRWLVAGVLAVGWLAEVQLHSPVPLPLPATQVALPEGLLPALSALPEGEGVLVLPLSQETSYLLQSHHDRPVSVRFRPGLAQPGQDPRLADATGAITSFLSKLTRRNSAHNAPPLEAAGIGAVVLVPALLPPSVAERTQSALRQELGEPAVLGDVFVYTVRP